QQGYKSDMNGAESLIRALLTGGVEVCFTNPGTSEMHVVAALDRVSEIRCVLGLFEGVVTGAADGYARMAGKPACTLLHLGPGLANGVANLHNASRAHVPIVNIVGQHALHHLCYDPPLASDIEAIARPYSKWLRTSQAAADIRRDATDAIVAANAPPGQIATLIVPADVAWDEISSGERNTGNIPTFPMAPKPDSGKIERAAEMLRSGLRTAILLSDKALYGKGLDAAGRIAAGTNAKLLAPYPFTRMERGEGLPAVERMHYVLEQAVEQLKEFRQIILVGSLAPVSYFAYPGKNSVLTSPDCVLHTLASPNEDLAGALNALAAEFSPNDRSPVPAKAERPPVPSGEISSHGVATAVAALLPENTIVVDESMTSGRGLMAATKGCPRHDWLANTGGSIGIAMPLAVGAAIASPNRRVLCFSADGSGMYTAQALWTMARENLNVTTVIFANRAYAVLRREYSSLGVGDPGPRAADLFDIGRPELDWVSLARGMGVPGTRVTTLDTFVKALQEGFLTDGPTLVEVRI
ncbi:MAG TPA: acetolactate synthase large subunit, partial [Terriglobales bacterium]|nr:acetolactate synthase large subunit [Terriglobales bacterium]